MEEKIERKETLYLGKMNLLTFLFLLSQIQSRIWIRLKEIVGFREEYKERYIRDRGN